MKMCRNIALALAFAVLAMAPTKATAQEWSQCVYIAGMIEQWGGECDAPHAWCIVTYHGYVGMRCDYFGGGWEIFCCADPEGCGNPNPPNNIHDCVGG